MSGYRWIHINAIRESYVKDCRTMKQYPHLTGFIKYFRGVLKRRITFPECDMIAWTHVQCKRKLYENPNN